MSCLHLRLRDDLRAAGSPAAGDGINAVVGATAGANAGSGATAGDNAGSGSRNPKAGSTCRGGKPPRPKT